MKALILAGGSGERLWPLSRKNYPKQFLKLNGDTSLLQQTTERVLGVVSPEGVVMLTNDDYKFLVLSDFKAIPHIGDNNTVSSIYIILGSSCSRVGKRGCKLV